MFKQREEKHELINKCGRDTLHPNVVENKEHIVFVLLEVYRSGHLYAHGAPMPTSTR